MLEGDDRTVGVREGGLEMGEDLGRGLVLRRDDRAAIWSLAFDIRDLSTDVVNQGTITYATRPLAAAMRLLALTRWTFRGRTSHRA